MGIDEIKQKWQLKQKNKQASIDMWNSMADSFGDFVLPDFNDDAFLNILKENNMLKKNTLVLDVGCGAGKYSVAVANCCKHVTGIDLSPKMIEVAKQKAVEYNIKNADFYCQDWHQLDIEKSEYLHKFDLVFAHMTPAIQSLDTFEKLSEASKDWCVLVKPIKRTDPLSETVKKMVGISQCRESCDDEILFAFEILWRQGNLPQLKYEKQVWNMKKTLDEACGLYINRIKTYKDITSEQEESIKDYLATLAKDGFIYEDVDTTIATLFWQV